MTEGKSMTDFLKSLTLDTVASLIGVTSSGVPHKATLRSVANMAFTSVTNNEDLDNPTTRGIFNVNKDTIITRPAKGSGWDFGYVINLASATGIQVWVNFSGYIAVRGKGSSGGTWSDWSVMAKM